MKRTTVSLAQELLDFLDKESARTRRSRDVVLEWYLLKGIESGEKPKTRGEVVLDTISRGKR